MPLPRWLAGINKRTFNRMELRRGNRPVVIHVGRVSGNTFETPPDAHAVDGGYIFILMYGAGSDWVKNVLAAGTARLRIDGTEIDLESPRLLTEEEAWEQLPATAKAPASFLQVTEYLRVDARQ